MLGHVPEALADLAKSAGLDPARIEPFLEQRGIGLLSTGQEAPRSAPLQQLHQKLQTYVTKTKLFLKSDEGRKIGAAAAFVFIALLLRALGGMVAAPPAPKRTMPALNFVWNHGEGATLAWRQGEPLKFVWRHGEYVWHVIRPAGRRPYLYLAGAP